MRIVRFAAGGRKRYGVLSGASVRTIAGNPCRGIKYIGESFDPDRVRLLAPCVPTKIVALGLNYRSHAGEMKMNLPSEPLIFLKPATSVIGPEDVIIYPESSRQVDYEAELGVVIKARACRVSKEEAARYILGYTCFNDVTARDIQSRDKQWTRAKGFDTFSPIGPWIETELDPRNLRVETYLNGALKQQGTTGDLIFGVPELVSFISHVMTLLPGDVIATGTPAGIGPMQKGDTVEIRVESIGTLSNRVA